MKRATYMSKRNCKCLIEKHSHKNVDCALSSSIHQRKQKKKKHFLYIFIEASLRIAYEFEIRSMKHHQLWPHNIDKVMWKKRGRQMKNPQTTTALPRMPAHKSSKSHRNVNECSINHRIFDHQIEFHRGLSSHHVRSTHSQSPSIARKHNLTI